MNRKAPRPLVNKKYKLEKFPGKGGWTYAAIPEIPADKKAHFGWVKVKGTINGYAISSYHLMPMGNGKLFLPVKAAIRKAIGKKAGDEVTVTLFPDNDPVQIPDELKACLENEPRAYKIFLSYTDGEQMAFINWVYEAKKEETRAQRIVTMLRLLDKGLKLHERNS